MKISIGFTGDTAFSEFTKDFYKDKNNLDKEIYKFLNKNDYNILNFESPITAKTKNKKAALAHKSDLEAADFIKENIKNPIFSIANNHMMDYEEKGLTDTISNLKKKDIPFIGAGMALDEATKYLILGQDVKVGVLSFEYKDLIKNEESSPIIAHEKHKKTIKQKVQEAKKQSDWVVVIYHGGEEFLNSPMPYTKRYVKKILSWGADIVVAHHPHTIQGYERIGKKMVFYSLANFIFDTEFQRAQIGTDKGVLLRLTFDKDSYSFENIIIANDREKQKIKVIENDKNFKDIKNTWKKEWKKEAGRLEDIKQRRKELRKYRNRYSISNLNIEKANCDSLISIQELLEKYYFEGLNEKVEFKGQNIFVRKITRVYRKLKRANYRRAWLMMRAKLFRW